MGLIVVQFRVPLSVSGSVVWGWLIMLRQEEIERHSVDKTQVPLTTRTEGRFSNTISTTKIVPESATYSHPTLLVQDACCPCNRALTPCSASVHTHTRKHTQHGSRHPQVRLRQVVVLRRSPSAIVHSASVASASPQTHPHKKKLI